MEVYGSNIILLIGGNMFYPLLISFLAGLSTCIGILFTYIKTKNINRLICISLSFAFGVMFLLSIKELIPISFIFIINNIYYPLSILTLIIISILSYLLIIITNKYQSNDKLYRIGVLSMIILLIHNIPEGIITFISSYTNIKLGIKLGLSIMAHNIPEGICISIPIYYATKSRGRALLFTFISGIAEPIGGLLIYVLFKQYINIYIINILLYFIGNLMIFICLNNIIIEIIKYKNIYWFLYGVLLSLFILFI